MSGQPPPLTYLDVVKNPSLLARPSSTQTPLRSFEGRVGNILQDVVVTSPNMDVVYMPPINICQTRMRQYFNFGPDDPLLHPQPFNPSIPHLAVICLKCHPANTAAEKQIMWTKPIPDLFVESRGFGSGLGRLESSLLSRTQSLCLDLIAATADFASDTFVRDAAKHLRRFTDRLDLPATCEETLLRFSCIQRLYRELQARNDWLRQFLTRDASVRTTDPHRSNPPIMGAFTESLDDADMLFQGGIPVWLIRSFARFGDVRIDKVVDFVNISPSILTMRDGEEVDIGDAEPSRPVVYSHLANKPERYLAMANYIHSFISYPLLLGSNEARSSVSMRKSALPITPASMLRQISSGSSTNLRRVAPYKKPSAQSAKQGHNTFLNPPSPLMPPCIPAWQSALAVLSGYNQSLEAPEGVDRGFYLPPPRVLVIPESESKRAKYFAGWLKLREVFLYRLSVPDIRGLTNKQWRALLDVSDGNNKIFNNQSRSGQQHSEMQTLLKEVLGGSRMRLKWEDLAEAPVMWKGQTLDQKVVPPVACALEIVWELHEVNFRHELIALDTRLDKSSMSRIERTNLLDACWSGSADHVSIIHWKRGLGGPTLEDRLPYLHALHQLISTWDVVKPKELLDPFPWNGYDGQGNERKPRPHNFTSLVEKVEREMANLYTTVFLDIFGRAPIVPHRLHS